MSWRRVLGHESIAEAFGRAFQRGRLAHGYLFVGPAGIGKRLFAGELAKALLCENRPKGRLEACNHCPSCLLMDGGTHPDFFTAVRPEDKASFPIDEIRELGRKLALKPVRGAGKIAILDDADDLNDPITQHAAANAFLKTLEEPPPGSIVILVGTGVDQQLSTILSRCQVVRFDPLPEPVVEQCLRNAGVTDAAAIKRAARLANGSPGQAMALTDAAFWEFRRTLLSELAKRPLDSVGLARAWMSFVEGAGKESSAQRQRASVMLRLLVDFLTDALAVSQDGEPRRGSPEDRPALEALAQLGPDTLFELLERCLAADRQIDRRVQLVLVIEALLDAIGQKLRPVRV